VLAGEGATAAGAEASAAESAAAAVVAHCRILIDRAGPACVAVKPQLACFERLGAPGWEALTEVCAAAREAGLLTIADGKRGDVPVTAAAYAQSLVGETPTPWGPVAGLGADAFTANPLLGRDAMEPLIAAAASSGAGVFALVRTSNPGAADVQDLPAPDLPLHERLAEMVDDLSGRLLGDGGLSGMGAVVGATVPEHLARMRELMPRSIFLRPDRGLTRDSRRPRPERGRGAPARRRLGDFSGLKPPAATVRSPIPIRIPSAHGKTHQSRRSDFRHLGLGGSRRRGGRRHRGWGRR
jgi:orotidine-5'-phosphate decarboxylase